MASEVHTLRQVLLQAIKIGTKNSYPSPEEITRAIDALIITFDTLNTENTDLLPFQTTLDWTLPPNTIFLTWAEDLPDDAIGIRRHAPAEIVSIQHISPSVADQPLKLEIYRNRVDFDRIHGLRGQISLDILQACLIEQTAAADSHLAITLSSSVARTSTLRFTVIDGFSSANLQSAAESDDTVREAALNDPVRMASGLYSLLVYTTAVKLQESLENHIDPHLINERDRARFSFASSRRRYRTPEVQRLPGFPLG